MIELKNIRHWIFDLDNTLYPNTTNLFDKIDTLMCKFIEDNLNVTPQESLKIKDTYFHEHGTTLNGLMQNHKIDAEKFLDFVHDIDYSLLNEDIALGEQIQKLPGEKIIFTNGTRKHAKKVTQQLGIENNFSKIFDIVDANFIPKPKIEPYHALIATHSIDAQNSIFIEDIAKNLLPAHELGMKTAWVESDDSYCKQGYDGKHVHYTIKNLTDFLKKINESIN
mgnify:FL=1|jgi:putative hydrolase of the HAD superfamily